MGGFGFSVVGQELGIRKKKWYPLLISTCKLGYGYQTYYIL